ncbi:hypothetical protein AVEN_168471-1 [Araneus ventricosus]|uniref:Uncharacterized protein n=1 Tax=Araneus ventricosus TaxID=182803 RepID=A0A4Y2Q427_ARAVE|nr:hypothetical protein AVEN_168471-1 [Araneus ventricosus]
MSRFLVSCPVVPKHSFGTLNCPAFRYFFGILSIRRYKHNWTLNVDFLVPCPYVQSYASGRLKYPVFRVAPVPLSSQYSFGTLKCPVGINRYSQHSRDAQYPFW